MKSSTLKGFCFCFCFIFTLNQWPEITKEKIKQDVKEHVKMCFEINTQLLLVQRKEDDTTTKFLLEGIMFFAPGIKEKSNFVKTMCHPSRCCDFFSSLWNLQISFYKLESHSFNLKITIRVFIIKIKLYYIGIKYIFIPYNFIQKFSIGTRYNSLRFHK